jgi:serine/threonine protein kinase
MTKSSDDCAASSLVEALVAEYRKELAAGDIPPVNEYLERISAELQPVLAEYLVPLEYAACFRKGWLPTVEDFKGRMPEHAELVERVLANSAGSPELRWVLIRKLGQGQMGEVFLARDENGRDVAIKLLKRAGGIAEAAQRAFDEEIKAMARLGLHPNVVALYHKDVLPDGGDGSTAAVMQYVPGQTLRQYLDSLKTCQQNAAVAEVVQLVMGIANGLAHLQSGRLQAHRDLKPQNIILDSGQSPLISDFGLATLLSQDRIARTVRGGTPKYMAPEQVRHFLGNHREDLHNCDIWAAGVILYETLTGELPFLGSGDELFENIEHATPVPPRRLRDDPAFNTTLEQICLKCLEKQPGERYSTAADLRDALQAWLDAYQGTPKLTKEIRDFTDVRKQYEHVTERKSVGEQINAFLATNPKGLLVIKGPPGKGKSAIAVDLEKRLTRAGGNSPVAFYFRKRTADPDDCVRHVYASLAIQHGISSPDTYRLPPEPAKALKALRLLLRDVASRVAAERPQVIILDALDEAQSVGDEPNPYQVINELMSELPDHVYLIATSRSVPELATLDSDAPQSELDFDNPDYLPQYRRDVRDYLERELSQLTGATPTEPLLDRIAQVADGNFLVARLICNELRERGGTIRDVRAVLEELLQENGRDRLGKLYQHFVSRLWSHDRVGQHVRGVLRVLAFAEADVTPALIRAATGLEVEQWHTVQDVLGEFLYIKTADAAMIQEDRIRPFHASFRVLPRDSHVGCARVHAAVASPW